MGFVLALFDSGLNGPSLFVTPLRSASLLGLLRVRLEARFLTYGQTSSRVKFAFSDFLESRVQKKVFGSLTWVRNLGLLLVVWFQTSNFQVRFCKSRLDSKLGSLIGSVAKHISTKLWIFDSNSRLQLAFSTPQVSFVLNAVWYCGYHEILSTWPFMTYKYFRYHSSLSTLLTSKFRISTSVRSNTSKS
jgi:hypothetical protein